jgi:hypothetical protein
LAYLKGEKGDEKVKGPVEEMLMANQMRVE